MSSFTRVYIINLDQLCNREVPSKFVSNHDGMHTVSEWLADGPDCDYIWQALFDKIGPGVRFVTYISGTGWYSEIDDILKFCPELSNRFKPVASVDYGGNKLNRKAYDIGSDFPIGHDSCLSIVNCPGWQFFSYDEIEILVKGLEKYLVTFESHYKPAWEEIIIDHKDYQYDLMFFEHMV